jgi:Kef-type K+ transport system membrane component KefB
MIKLLLVLILVALLGGGPIIVALFGVGVVVAVILTGIVIVAATGFILYANLGQENFTALVILALFGAIGLGLIRLRLQADRKERARREAMQKLLARDDD